MGKLDFVDSSQFLSISLEKLVHNLAKQGAEKFKHLKQYIERKYPRFIKEKLEFLMRKGVYPYEYIDNKDKFNETCLPDRSAIFSSNSDQSVSKSDYDYAKIVWKMFQISNMGEYHDL